MKELFQTIIKSKIVKRVILTAFKEIIEYLNSKLEDKEQPIKQDGESSQIE